MDVVKSAADCETVIIGAGPYGLSLASQLTGLGRSFRIFGESMATWHRMPRQINLKSPPSGTTIYTPDAGYKLLDWCRINSLTPPDPFPMSVFAAYGDWVQQQLVPEVERTTVRRVAGARHGFDIELSTGERLSSQRVVMATGLTGFEQFPTVLSGLPETLVSHTSNYSSFEAFAGRRVAVVGAGASALEVAVALREAGAEVSLLVRSVEIVIKSRGNPDTGWRRFATPDSCMGPGRRSFALQKMPSLLHYFPQKTRTNAVHKAFGPAGSWWIRDKLYTGIDIHLSCRIDSAVPTATGIRLMTTHDGGGSVPLDVEHVICGTGFRPDVDRIQFIEPRLAARVRRIDRAPALSRRFETSVPGLHMIGPVSALSFGPMFRFVCGAEYTAPSLARYLARQARPLRSARQPVDHCELSRWPWDHGQTRTRISG